jgi:hypothetical protein
MAARAALHFHEIAGAKILDTSGVEGHHRPQLCCLSVLASLQYVKSRC